MQNPMWWIATVLQLVGVFALDAVSPTVCYYNAIGILLRYAASAKDRNLALLLLNLGYTLANIVGIVSMIKRPMKGVAR
jgi:hypothetical protein